MPPLALSWLGEIYAKRSMWRPSLDPYRASLDLAENRRNGRPRHAGGWRFLRSFGMSNAGVRRAKASQIDVFDHVDYGRRVVGGNGI